MKKLYILLFLLGIMILQSSAEIGIIVNKSLYPFIQSSINQYIADLNIHENKTVWLNGTTFDETRPIKQLKDSLVKHYNLDNLEGALFIGNLPIAEYEIRDTEYDRFPMDLYYMDLNGNWLDTATIAWSTNAASGVFDGHSGDTYAEIWVSRIIAGNLGRLGNEIDIVNSYLFRLHNRMSGIDELSIPRYLLCANDTEWRSSPSWTNAEVLGYHPDSVDTYLQSNKEDTRDNWKDGLVRGYESAMIVEHSGPTSHGLMDGYDNDFYLLGKTTNTRFYNLYACSNARYTIPEFLGGLYAFGHNGLISVGSTKSGAMMGFEHYYEPLSKDSSFGESYKSWFNAYVLNNPDPGDIYWHYGMTLLGAGTLHMYQKKFATSKLAVYLKSDLSPNASSIESEFRIVNRSSDAVNMSDFNLVYYTYDPSMQTSDFEYNIKYCSKGTATVKFERLSDVYESANKKADTKITISFTGATLAAHDSLLINAVFKNIMMQYSFNESDDWSHSRGVNGFGENVNLFSKSLDKTVFGYSPDAKLPEFELKLSQEPIEDTATASFTCNTSGLAGKTAVVELYSNGVFQTDWSKPISAGVNNLKVNLSTFDQGIYAFYLKIDGSYTDTIFVNHHRLGSRTFRMTFSDMIFSDAVIGHGTSKKNILFNDGISDLTISSITSTNPSFVISEPLPIVITAYRGRYIGITYNPTGNQSDTGTIIFTSDADNAQDVNSIKLSGNGIYDYGFSVNPNPLSSHAMISFDIQNPSLYNTVADFGLARINPNGSSETVESFTATITQGTNTIARHNWDTLPAGNYSLGMRFAGWMVVAARCTFQKQTTSYGLAVSPATFSTGAEISFTMQNPMYIGKTAQYSLYSIFRNGSPGVLRQQFTGTIAQGVNTISKSDWDYLPCGYYEIEMSCNGRLLDSYSIEKLSNPARFSLSVSPSPVIDKAAVSFSVSDANLIGKTAFITCRQNGTVKFSRTQTIAEGTNTLNITFNDYTQLSAGQYKMYLSVCTFDVDSSAFTKVDKNTTVTAIPVSVNFGEVVLNTPKTATVTLKNTGNSDALISSLILSKSVFTRDGVTPITIAPGASKVITLTFKPTAAGTVADTLRIINAPDANIQTIKVPIDGHGVNQTADLQVTMTPDGNGADNSIQPQIVIKNSGAQSLNVSDLQIEYYTYDASVTLSNLRADIYNFSINSVTANGVTAAFSRLSPVAGNSNRKADVLTRFTLGAGTLAANQSIAFSFGIHTADWQYNFNEADDWSRLVGTGNIASNIVIRSKSSGIVLYGTVPVNM